MAVFVLQMREKNPYSDTAINTTSHSGINKDLSPFLLGPIETYKKGVYALNFENLWQYSKCYPEFLRRGKYLTWSWFKWRKAGWNNPRAVRYPMDKGRKPNFSYWDGEKLSYIDARKRIYTSIYGKYVVKTDSFKQLRKLYKKGKTIVLRDFDGYDHNRLGVSLVEVINNPNRIMGHAFVIAMLLTDVFEDCISSPTPKHLKLKL